MNQLPCELKLKVLGYLASRDLKAMKQQATVWAVLTTPMLFQQICVAPQRKTLEYFDQITQNANLTASITHLVYYDSQPAKSLLRRGDCLAALPATYSQAEKIKAWKTFCKVYYDQQLILTTEEDFETLVCGLAQLPKLQKVTIAGGPSRLSGSSWYFHSGPHAWDFVDTGLSSSHWSYPTDIGYHEWDGRGVKNLFRALDQTHTHPTEMHICNWFERQSHLPIKMGLPLSTLNPLEATMSTLLLSVGRRIFGVLTVLNLQIDLHTRSPGRQIRQNYRRDVAILCDLVRASKQLKQLSLGFTGFQFPAPLSKRILTESHLTSLDTLRFRKLEVFPSDLELFLNKHKITLIRLTLDRVSFDQQSVNRTWGSFVAGSQVLQSIPEANLRVGEWVQSLQGGIFPRERVWRRGNGTGRWLQ